MGNNKVLYFESAGMEGTQYNDVENCRIRTAFTNNLGQKIYIELTSGHMSNNKKGPEFHYIACNYCHYITEDPERDDCNCSRLACNSKPGIEWTKANILKFVNENCNCDFTEVVILHGLAGYYVFSGDRKVNKGIKMMEDFNYDAELTDRRIAKRAELKEHFEKLFNQKYDNTSYYIKNGEFTVCINVEESKRIAAGYTERIFTVEV